MTKEGFLWSIVASIIATIILNIIIYIIQRIRNRKRNTLNKRLREANVKAFFYNRKVLREDSGGVGEDIAYAENHVYLIGSWLSTSLNKDFEEAVIAKVESGVEFFFCFNGLDLNIIQTYSYYMNGKNENVIKSLYNTYNKLFEIKNRSTEISKKIHIHLHNQMLPTTFWGIDTDNKENSYYKLDHKVVQGEISSSYGLQYGYSKEFSENIKDAYMYVFNNSKEVYSLKEILENGKEINKDIDCNILTQNFK